MSGPTVSAIVVSHNSADLLPDCLGSLLKSGWREMEAIVIDNASTDGSGGLVRSAFPSVRVFEYGTNAGFGAGVNRGARVARGDYIFLLNPDARVRPDTVGLLVERMEADERAAIAGPIILASPTDRRISSAGLRANRILYASDRSAGEMMEAADRSIEEVLGVTGSAMMIRKEAWEALGGFDERYFLYYEDLDLCIRAWIAGWKVLLCRGSEAYHPLKEAMRHEVYDEYLDCRNRWRTILKNVSFPRIVPMAARATLFDLNGLKNHILNGRWRRAGLRLKALLWIRLHGIGIILLRGKIARMRKAGDEAFTRFLDDRKVRF